jgi:cell division cycle 14
VCPKLVAFKGPLATGSPLLLDGEAAFPPAHYATILLRLGVTAVVRLNEPGTYDAGEFEAAGLRHHELFFPDCTAPPAGVVARFLDIVAAEARVAVHCRAGLGRTGTLIAVWLMRRAGFSANEAIAWLRIVRPGRWAAAGVHSQPRPSLVFEIWLKRQTSLSLDFL